MDFELAYIAERDTDFALMREASLSKDVQNLFLRKVGESGTLVKIIHSLTQEEEPGKVGESDVVLIFERPDKSRFAIFVEDKIAASAQPRQRERYELRAPKLETELGLKGHHVVLFAPKKYLDKETSQGYTLQISHESVADLCVDELDKKVLSDSCKVKQHGKTQIDYQITDFWNHLIDYIGDYHADLAFTKDKVDRGPNSYWPEFGTSLKGVAVVYKSDQNVVDLTFNKMATKRINIITIFETIGIDSGDRYFTDVGESLALRKNLLDDAKIDFRKPFDAQKDNVDKVIDEVRKMVEMAKKIGNSKYSSIFAQ